MGRLRFNVDEEERTQIDFEPPAGSQGGEKKIRRFARERGQRQKHDLEMRRFSEVPVVMQWKGEKKLCGRNENRKKRGKITAEEGKRKASYEHSRGGGNGTLGPLNHAGKGMFREKGGGTVTRGRRRTAASENVQVYQLRKRKGSDERGVGGTKEKGVLDHRRRAFSPRKEKCADANEGGREELIERESLPVDLNAGKA